MTKSLFNRWAQRAFALLLTAGIAARVELVAAGPAPIANESAKHELQRAIDKGLAWMEKNQDPKGFWSTADHPALTALTLVALQGDPSSATVNTQRKEKIDLGYQFLLSCVHEDGIYGKKELVNYNTSVGLMALAAANSPKYAEAIRNARKTLIQLQYDGGEKGVADTPFDGGVGYGGSSSQPDLVNTMHALEALYYSKPANADASSSEPDLNWQAAIQFLQNCQHIPQNKQPWVSLDATNSGGFIYSPESSKAGEMEVANGRKALRAYASISYAGMLSYVYAGLKPEDPRVVAVLDWARRNYTLDENPGMGPQGLYFYFHTMAKALSVAKIDALKTSDGKSHNWREELAMRLINLQNNDGSWANDNGRWWEKDPVLATAYSVIALEMIHRAL